MDDTQRREKLDIVWASVFLTAFAALSWMILIFLGAFQLPFVAKALTVSAGMSIVTVPLLLSVPGSSPALLAGGRILLWLQAICLGAGCAVSVSEMIR